MRGRGEKEQEGEEGRRREKRRKNAVNPGCFRTAVWLSLHGLPMYKREIIQKEEHDIP